MRLLYKNKSSRRKIVKSFGTKRGTLSIVRFGLEATSSGRIQWLNSKGLIYGSDTGVGGNIQRFLFTNEIIKINAGEYRTVQNEYETSTGKVQEEPPAVNRKE